PRGGTPACLRATTRVSRLQIRSGSFTSPAETDRCSRDCAAVDIQVIGRKAHPPTSLNGWVGCQNQAVCESSCRKWTAVQVGDIWRAYTAYALSCAAQGKFRGPRVTESKASPQLGGFLPRYEFVSRSGRRSS